jgi:uncharacterized cupredoxin-like copper-binding protein
MRRAVFLAGLIAGCVGLLAAGAVASSAVFSTHSTAANVITVVAGKPSELKFQLSKSTKLKVGTYTFKVTNKGLGFHTFKFCTTPVKTKTATKNTCVGKVTKTLKPGQSASFTVTIKKAGKYEFLCSIPGHAAAGMKGLMGFGVAVTPVPTTPTTTSGGGGGGGGGTTTTAGTGTTANGCPAGTPPGTTIGSDEDGDESDAVGKDDGDGCL